MICPCTQPCCDRISSMCVDHSGARLLWTGTDMHVSISTWHQPTDLIICTTHTPTPPPSLEAQYKFQDTTIDPDVKSDQRKYHHYFSKVRSHVCCISTLHNNPPSAMCPVSTGNTKWSTRASAFRLQYPKNKRRSSVLTPRQDVAPRCHDITADRANLDNQPRHRGAPLTAGPGKWMNDPI